jgi:hypothetical protein
LLDNHGERINELEKDDRRQSLAVSWVFGATWAAAGAFGMVVLKVLGLT